MTDSKHSTEFGEGNGFALTERLSSRLRFIDRKAH